MMASADVPPGYRRYLGLTLETVSRALSAAFTRKGYSVFRRASDRASHRQALAHHGRMRAMIMWSPGFRHHPARSWQGPSPQRREPQKCKTAAETIGDVAASTVLSEAPMPVAVPTMPCARLKWPAANATSANDQRHRDRHRRFAQHRAGRLRRRSFRQRVLQFLGLAAVAADGPCHDLAVMRKPGGPT